MIGITDDYMRKMLTKTKEYTVVLLKDGPNANHPDRQSIVWEHGRKNFALRSEGLLSIVCPVASVNEVKGLAIFNASLDQTVKIMEDDPAVKEGIFLFEIMSVRSFPGNSLP